MEFTVLHLFAGIGGAALGFQQAVEEYKGVVGRFRTLAGIDVDPDACADFERLTGAPAVQMDLFTRQQYVAFHGHEPPADWREADADDIFAATGGEYPDVVFLSPPCKGFSLLLPGHRAETAKYRALNHLVLRGLDLVLRAFDDNPPKILMIENVPGITGARGRAILEEVKRRLRSCGYALHEGHHDCGEIGGIAQHRRRYLLIARHKAVSAFVYRPPVRKVRTIGEVLEGLPLPDEPLAGRMHQLPKLKRITWERLSLIRAGYDWRDLEGTDAELSCRPRSGAYKVQRWDEPSATVIGAGDVHAAAVAVADPRVPELVRVADDGTWHRPLTTLELAVLQGFPAFTSGGAPLQLAGTSEVKWRERIGNAVPPPAAKAIGEQILLSLLPSAFGEWALGATPVWVQTSERIEVFVH